MMKHYMRNYLSFILCLLFIVLPLAGCGSSVPSTSITITPKDKNIIVQDYTGMDGSAMMEFPEEWQRINQIKEQSNGKEIRLKRNQTVYLTIKMDPKKSNKQVNWSSSNEDIAKVDQDGKVTTFDKGGCAFIKAETPSGVSDALSISISKTQEEIVQDFIEAYSKKLDIATKEQALCLKNQIVNKANLFQGNLHQQLLDLSKKADEVPDNRTDQSNHTFPGSTKEKITDRARSLAQAYDFTFYYTVSYSTVKNDHDGVSHFSADSDQINKEMNQIQPVKTTTLNTQDELTDLMADMVHYCLLKRCEDHSINALSITVQETNVTGLYYTPQYQIQLYMGKVNEEIDPEGGYDFDAFD